MVTSFQAAQCHNTEDWYCLYSGSVVVVVTRLWAGQSGVCFPAGAIDFTLLHYNQTSSGAHPSTYSYSPGLKQSGHKVVHSLPGSAAFKNEWSCASNLRMYCHGLQRVKFTFLHSMKLCIVYSVCIHVHTSEEYIIFNHLNKLSVMVKIHTIMYYLVDEHIDVLLFTGYMSITFFRVYIMSIYVHNLFIKNPFLCYLHNNLIELLVYHTEIFEAFFPL
jgi:hypothetical protein